MTSATVALKSTKREVWREALDRSAREVFAAILGIHLEVASQEPASFEFTATVGFAGDLRGVISLSCNRSTAMSMTESMLKSDYTASEDQIWDALGEICNVLAGRFKNGPPRLANNCILSVPTVITGSNYQQHPLGGAGTLQKSFLLKDQMIRIAVAIHEQPPSK